VPLLAKWLEYLHILNLEKFYTDLWKAMLRSNKHSPEPAPEAIARAGRDVVLLPLFSSYERKPT
jgi:hypothetical protein